MPKTIHRVLILGGYGNFGKRIAENLSQHLDLTIFIAGRNRSKAEYVCRQLAAKTNHTKLVPYTLDILSPCFQTHLTKINPDLVIHTSGPFQQQDYRVPQACIDIQSHYIDLADDRQFVTQIDQLNDKAISNNCAIISGASSVPGLSTCVVNELSSQYQSLESLDIAIAPGNKAERGIATLKGILSYTGHPYKTWSDRKWQTIYGWMDNRRVDFGQCIGMRNIANVEVPDLDIFPALYPEIHQVTFQAGLELRMLHQTMVAMAWLSKAGIIKNWAKWSSQILKLSHLFDYFGTDVGGMRIKLTGVNHHSQPISTTWLLIAEHNVGPYIPTIPAIILANKLIQPQTTSPQTIKIGARPCIAEFSLSEFDIYASPLEIKHETIVMNNKNQ